MFQDYCRKVWLVWAGTVIIRKEIKRSTCTSGVLCRLGLINEKQLWINLGQFFSANSRTTWWIGSLNSHGVMMKSLLIKYKAIEVHDWTYLVESAESVASALFSTAVLFVDVIVEFKRLWHTNCFADSFFYKEWLQLPFFHILLIGNRVMIKGRRNLFEALNLNS